jgi:CheY-like chemotaxis protein
MSYPLTIHALVIEDDEGAKEAYKGIFESISADVTGLPFSAVLPSFAFSYEEAVACLESSKIFHVVILDLRLPAKPKMPTVEGVELGINLLNRCIERDLYPIPCLLVISGHIGSTEQARLQDATRQGFHYGRTLVKGDYALLEAEIRQACNEALRYCSVGVHVRDAGQEEFPTISPREEDLLRRSVLQQSGTIGLDLTWWSAKRLVAISKNRSERANPWTKVLMGRYLLDGGRGASRPKFFKLMDGFDAKNVIESARYVEQKLSHIKLAYHITTKSCALIVTEKVGALDTRPSSLETIFKGSEPGRAREVALQIADQVQQLGDLLPESKPLKALLWPGHDIGLVTEQWNRFAPQVREQLNYDADPVSLFSQLLASEETQRITERSLVHGDLHMSNVALDLEPHEAHAYIFDAGIVKRNVAGRDIAVIEASVLLHQRIEHDVFVQICSILYGPASSGTDDVVAGPVVGIAQEIVEFIQALREAAKPWNDLEIYALMVFDFVLIQVGGMAFGSYGNKIVDQQSAAYLLVVVGEWYRRLHNANPIEADT